MELHGCQVYRIPRRQVAVTEQDFLGSLDGRLVHRKYFVNDSQQNIERRLNGIQPFDRGITMKDFLQHFRVCHQAFSVAHQLFQPTPGIGFMGMRSSHQVHWDVRVDKDHGCMPDP